MTTPPPEITDEHVALLADLHTVITQAIEDTPYVIGQPVGPFAAIITADVAAYMGRQVAGVAAELDAARAENDRLRQQLAQARNAALTEGAELIAARRAEEAAHERDHSDFADEHEMELETDAIDRAAGWLLAARTQPAT